ncbi:hypothetical protein [Frigoriflavimonas asaccharolytica]|uniref:Uncharacterized protein n=1 Tax=Frigoriflavimonas asaccharolytica TaxID=2735899 RepID=A0A8J8G5I4_9FLAO|nr:hypothetical protein [Frigoriflavimonas asaccharolytica]NRS91646.1 hypothetical protein [Frigoriflavimonas asaccharolytica]
MLQIINQVFEIQKKALEQNISLFERNLERIQQEFEDLGFLISNPLGKYYDERDTSLEVNLVGDSKNPKIVKVLKPAIFQKDGTDFILMQKGIVIAE